MQLSIITLGHVHTEELEPLSHNAAFTKLEQLVLDINPRDPLSKHRAEFNRAIDASTADWILIVREREKVTEELAGEIVAVIKGATAWGFRVRVDVLYQGQPLRLRLDDGEVRLFHKRHYLRFANKGEWDEVLIQGTIVRLRQPLLSASFASAEEHRLSLAQTGVRRSLVKRTLLFLRDAIGSRTTDRNTLRYIWTEAGFDRP